MNRTSKSFIIHRMEQVYTKKAPKVVGPYSQAIISNGFIFCAGQIGINPETGTLVEGIQEQTKQVLRNLSEVLKEAGSDLSKVVKTEVFLTDMNNYKVFNEIYAEVFSSDPKPARYTIGVSSLPANALVEISCIASR